MANTVVSRGQCNYCGKEYAGSGMSRHLQACQARQEVIRAKESSSGRKHKLYHLRVSGSYLPEYWMHIEIPAGSTLYDLDDFLRAVWLECCGHLSMFRIGEQRYVSFPLDVYDWNWDFPEDKEMNAELGKVLEPGTEFGHEYDFGTTTYLKIRVIDLRRGTLNINNGIEIMARNNAPDFRCEICEKTATRVCVMEEYRTMCAECGDEYGCAEYWLPIVNSPRVGECGYTGPAQAWDQTK